MEKNEHIEGLCMSYKDFEKNINNLKTYELLQKMECITKNISIYVFQKDSIIYYLRVFDENCPNSKDLFENSKKIPKEFNNINSYHNYVALLNGIKIMQGNKKEKFSNSSIRHFELYGIEKLLASP